MACGHFSDIGFVAAAISGFGELHSEQLRGEMYDHLIPMSLPMSHYEPWQQRFPLPAVPASSRHCAVVLVGQGLVEATLDSLENQTHGLWAACALDDCESTTFEASAAITFLSEDAPDSDVVVFALAGTVFEPNALRRILQAFSDLEEAVAVYGDVNVLAANGGVWPLAFPAFDYERLLEQGYCAHLFALRRDIAESLLAASPSNLYRLFNALFDQAPLTAAQVIHLPGALGTLPPPIKLLRRPISLASLSANHRFLSGPDVMPATSVLAVGIGYSEMPPIGPK